MIPKEKPSVISLPILISSLLSMMSCQTTGAHKTDPAPEQRSAKTQPTGDWSVPQTGQKKTYGSRDDGHLELGKKMPVPRFTGNEDGTVSDRLTGLIWTKNADQAKGKIDWDEALARSASCAEGGHKDWRLPNRNELSSLIDLGQAQPSLTTGHPFENVKLDYYWTSTTTANGEDNAWTIHFFVGFITQDDKGGTHYVWYVRGGQTGTS